MGGREQGEGGNMMKEGRGGREGERERGEGGSDDDRQGESVSGRREGWGREGC